MRNKRKRKDNKLIWKKTGFLLFLLIFLWGFNAMNLSMHEKAHYQIFKQAGYKNITIEYDNLFMEGVTTAYPNGEYIPENIELECYSLNAWNEIIGYHSNILINLIILLFFIGLYHYEFNKKR